MEPPSYWVDSECNKIAMAGVIRTVDVIRDDQPYFCTVRGSSSPCLTGLSLFETFLHCFRRAIGRFVWKIWHSLLVCLAAALGVP